MTPKDANDTVISMPSFFAKNKFKAFDHINMVAIYESVTGKQPKRTGRGWIGTCPFQDHDDHSPSFVMWDEIQRYHCYGCDKSGTASWFKHEMELLYDRKFEFTAQRSKTLV